MSKLSKEEKDFEKSLEKGEWRSVSKVTVKKEALRVMAPKTTLKSKRITLRVTEQDFHLAHIRSLREGIPYQTLMASIIHKYLTGTLKEAA